MVGSPLSKFVGEKENNNVKQADTLFLSKEIDSSTNNEKQALAKGQVKTTPYKITVYQVPCEFDEKVPQFSHFVLDFKRLTDQLSLTDTPVSSIKELRRNNLTMPTETKGKGPALLTHVKMEAMHTIG